MRVVILGARGFVAHALNEALRDAGTSVRAVPQQKIDLQSAEAADKISALVRREDALVVPAALTPDKGRDVSTFMKNLKMAEAVCQAVAATTCSHLVYVSSDAVYPTSPEPMTEDTACSPTDLYALMHTAREQMLGHVASDRGIPFCILRPCAIYGARDTHNSYGPNRFIRSALTERTIRLFGEGEEERDHVYIDDVIAVTRMVLERRTAGVLNVVTGRAVSFRAVAECVARHVQLPVTIQPAPRTGPITHRHFNPSRLRGTFPGIDMTPLEEGIARTVAAMRTSVV
jgi:UDP-glucose 4-epimerase